MYIVHQPMADCVEINSDSQILMYMHESCLRELKKFEKNPQVKKRIRSKILHYINQFRVEGIAAVIKCAGLEFLKGSNGFYKMKIDGGRRLKNTF